MSISTKSMPLKPQQLAFMALLLLAFIWGYNWVVMKIALRDAPAFEFAALRNVFGSLSIFLVMALRRQSLRPQVLWGSALFGLLQSGVRMTGGPVGEIKLTWSNQPRSWPVLILASLT